MAISLEILRRLIARLTAQMREPFSEVLVVHFIKEELED